MISQEQGSAHGSLRSRINPNLSIDVQNANRQGAGDMFNIIPQDNSHMDPAAGLIGIMSYSQAAPVQSVPVQPQAPPMSQAQPQQQAPPLASQLSHPQPQASPNQQQQQPPNPDPAQPATSWPGRSDDPAAMILESMRKSPRPGFDNITIQNNEEATRTMVALAKWVRELRKNSPQELNRNFELVSMLKELNSLTSIALNISHTELLPSSNPNTPMSANANRNIHEYYYDKFVPVTPNSPYYNFPTPGSVQSQPIATSPGLVSPRSYNPPWNMYSTPSTPLYNVPPSPNSPSQLSYLSIYGSPRGRRKSKFGISKMITCKQCGTDKTPEWRRGPDGPRTLCNACGLQHRKHQKLYGEEEANRIHRSKSQ